MRKKIFFLIIYLLCLFFASPIISSIKIDFLKKNININFLVYCGLFALILLLFRDIFIDSIKRITVQEIKRSICSLVIIFISIVVMGLTMSLVGIASENQQSINNAISNSNDKVLVIVTIVILGPIVEEIVYRYCIYTLFDKYKKPLCIISSILFALGHVFKHLLKGDFSQFVTMIPYIFFGVILCLRYYKSNNIIYPIGIHCTINTIIFLAGNK